MTICTISKSQAEQLTKEKEAAAKERDQTKCLLEKLRGKHQAAADSQSVKRTGLFAKSKKKKSSADLQHSEGVQQIHAHQQLKQQLSQPLPINSSLTDSVNQSGSDASRACLRPQSLIEVQLPDLLPSSPPADISAVSQSVPRVCLKSHSSVKGHLPDPIPSSGVGISQSYPHYTSCGSLKSQRSFEDQKQLDPIPLRRHPTPLERENQKELYDQEQLSPVTQDEADSEIALDRDFQFQMSNASTEHEFICMFCHKVFKMGEKEKYYEHMEGQHRHQKSKYKCGNKYSRFF